jgi:transposase
MDDVITRLSAEAKALAAESEVARQRMLVLARGRQECILGLHASGLSVRGIAERLGSSASVIQDAIRTAKGRHPQARREERFPFELHVMLGMRLRENLERLRRTPRAAVAERWLDRWEELLRLPDDELEKAMLADDEEGRDLRQISPFAGALSPEDRLVAMKKAQLLAKG